MKTKGKFIARGVVFGILAATFFTVALMLLWNWLMPLLFGLAVVTFWQALGILALSKILFGGGGRSHQSWRQSEKEKFNKDRFKEKFGQMRRMHDSIDEKKEVSDENK